MATVNNQYNLLKYDDTNYLFNVVSLEDSPLHVHREMQISLLLHGRGTASCMGEEITLERGDFWIINSMKSHRNTSLIKDDNLFFMQLQVPCDFFSAYYPEMDLIEFPLMPINRETIGEDSYKRLVLQFLRMAEVYFNAKPYYQLKSAGMLNMFFYDLLNTVPYELVKDEEKSASYEQVQSMRNLLTYIETHYMETLYLTDLANDVGLSMSRLSHIFKENLGISFQDYLAHVRCRKARALLLETDLKLIDICMACGFSDQKYFKKAFMKYYHMAPKEYRKLYRNRAHIVSGMLTASNTDKPFDDMITFFSREDNAILTSFYLEMDVLQVGE